MQSPELLEQTASERLTLDQEYEMQQSWFLDKNSMSVAIIETRLHCPLKLDLWGGSFSKEIKVCKTINLVTTKCHSHLISPYSISLESYIMVTRVMEKITNLTLYCLREMPNDQNDMRTKSYRGGKSSVILEGAMIFCLQCADLSMTFWLWKFQKKLLKIEYEMASYAIWHSWALTLYPPTTSVCIFFILFLIHFQRGWQGEFV